MITSNMALTKFSCGLSGLVGVSILIGLTIGNKLRLSLLSFLESTSIGSFETETYKILF